MSERTVLRPRMGLVVYGVIAAMALVAVISVILTPGAGRHLLSVLPLPILALGVGWITLVSPSVVFTETALEVNNPLKKTVVPYGQIELVETTRGFTVTTPEGKVSAWAAPPPDRLSAERMDPRDPLLWKDPRRLTDESQSIRTSAAPGTYSGDAAVNLTHRRAQQQREAGVPLGPVVRTQNVANTVVLIATLLVVGALFAI
ncbi:hypothetical protein [Pseudoclavibacter sp. AY1F1]|uniref:hypothetical protein n=1 Tax=Pseudoclavibacter sp. AY1F1 TaxID=2080583 RepID=UPI0011B06D6F|nr:hypothetical protein [Pseudoclavibacter sp. AY1F1]